MKIENAAGALQIGQEADQVLQGAAEPIDRPGGGPFSRAVSNYVPKMVTSRIICLISEESRSKIEYSWRPWTHLSGEVSYRHIPGTHLSCITTHVGEIARLLNGLFKAPGEILSSGGSITARPTA